MTLSENINLTIAGECMLELSNNESGFSKNFAGDVINFSTYVKRLSTSANIDFCSAVGSDVVSQQMLDHLQKEGIKTDLVGRSKDKTIGLYMIETDVQGERSFMYWRSDSAAKKMLDLVDLEKVISNAGDNHYFFFSGITLTILSPQDRSRFFDLVATLRSRGTTIVFDPNYRPTLWLDKKIAQQETNKAYSLTDILLSNLDDEKQLFDVANSTEALARLDAFELSEIVLTDGPDEAIAVVSGETFKLTPPPVTDVVDTTSAGDAFNAGYLVMRHNQRSPTEALQYACHVAAQVIKKKGAIPENLEFDPI